MLDFLELSEPVGKMNTSVWYTLVALDHSQAKLQPGWSHLHLCMENWWKAPKNEGEKTLLNRTNKLTNKKDI